MNKITASLLASLFVSSMGASLWVFQNVAWASDIERIEVRLIKRDLRDLRDELRHESDPEARAEIERDIEEALDDLCAIAPDDREC